MRWLIWALVGNDDGEPSVPRTFYIGFRPDSRPERDGVFGAALFRGYGE